MGLSPPHRRPRKRTDIRAITSPRWSLIPFLPFPERLGAGNHDPRPQPFASRDIEGVTGEDHVRPVANVADRDASAVVDRYNDGADLVEWPLGERLAHRPCRPDRTPAAHPIGANLIGAGSIWSLTARMPCRSKPGQARELGQSCGNRRGMHSGVAGGAVCRSLVATERARTSTSPR